MGPLFHTHDMKGWLVEHDLTVVSGTGYEASEAVARWPSTLGRQKDMAASGVDYVELNGTAEGLVLAAETDVDGPGQCSALCGVGASDHRARHSEMRVTFRGGRGICGTPLQPRTVFMWG